MRRARPSLVLAMCLGPCIAAAELPQGSAGAALFGRYCAACHGSDGTGGGATSRILTEQPPDLTGISAGNGGVFPVARIVRRIDGRDPRLAHGGGMPIYGAFFDGAATVTVETADGPLAVNLPVLEIVTFLQQIQR